MPGLFLVHYIDQGSRFPWLSLMSPEAQGSGALAVPLAPVLNCWLGAVIVQSNIQTGSLALFDITCSGAQL